MGMAVGFFGMGISMTTEWYWYGSGVVSA